MRIKANKSFCGILTMSKGEIREYGNEAVLSDLLNAGYIEEATEESAEEQTQRVKTVKKRRGEKHEG